MNYEKIYWSLIKKRQQDKLNRENGYCEFHHIKPASIYPELKNDKSNIVALTAREHFIAHLLLIRIYEKQQRLDAYNKMIIASAFLADKFRKTYTCKITSRIYDFLAKQRSKIASLRIGDKSWTYNKIWIFNIKTNEQRLIDKNDIIPLGWQKGMISNRLSDDELLKKYFKIVSWFEEYKKSGYNGVISKFNLHISKLNLGNIFGIFIDEFYKDGWRKKRIPYSVEDDLYILSHTRKEAAIKIGKSEDAIKKRKLLLVKGKRKPGENQGFMPNEYEYMKYHTYEECKKYIGRNFNALWVAYSYTQQKLRIDWLLNQFNNA